MNNKTTTYDKANSSNKGFEKHTPMMHHYLDVYCFPFVFNALNLR